MVSKTHFRGAYLLFFSPSLSFCLGRLSFTSISRLYSVFLFFLVRSSRILRRFLVLPAGTTTAKGQTLSSSAQRRRGKSCNTKTLSYFFKNSGIDSVSSSVSFSFGHWLPHPPSLRRLYVCKRDAVCSLSCTLEKEKKTKKRG